MSRHVAVTAAIVISCLRGCLSGKYIEPRSLRRRDWQCRKYLEEEISPRSFRSSTVAVALSIGVEAAIAGDNNVTEDQILQALAPPKAADPRPVGRPAGRPGEGRRRRRFCSENPQPGYPLAFQRRARGNRDDRQGQAEYRSGNQLRLQFGRYQRAIDALGSGAGKALTDPDLKGSTFVVAGYTDAAGGEAYNQDLSERRADSIKRYLIDKFGIAGSDLVTVGYGKTKLKDPSQPLAEANRRVQVVNMQNKEPRPSDVH